MKDYIQVAFETTSAEAKEILVALLTEAGYEGFEEERGLLKAFIPGEVFDEQALYEITGPLKIASTISSIESKNWNEMWESSFEPVIVNDFCAIRAHFHPPVPGVRHEIVITPKMSFGTGHHATTFMMIEAMEALNFSGKTVFDFGTGTGVLAILAEKCGGLKIDAIDNDEWSIENAHENIARNQCNRITLGKADRMDDKKYDIILANINRNIILHNLGTMRLHLDDAGTILLSGLLEADEKEIAEKAAEENLAIINKFEKHNWICLQCVTVNNKAIAGS